MKKLFLFLMLLAGVVACEEDKNSPVIDKIIKTEMIVVNEGQFTKGTAAISAVYNDGTVAWDVFRDVNNKPLGDVAQSLTYIDGKYFVVLNNSKQIKVIDPATFKLLGTIDYVEAASPRFMVPINDHEAIVSDLNAQLTKIDYKTYAVLEHLPMSITIEKMTIVGNKLFGAAGQQVVVFDNNNVKDASKRVVEGLEGTCMQTAKMIVDKNNKLWVLTTADGKAILNCIDPTTEKVVKKIQIPYISKSDAENYKDNCITGSPWYTRMDSDRTKGKLYFVLDILKGDKSVSAVITLDVDKDAVDKTPYRILNGLGMMYGMGISPEGDVYLCDCKDYTAQRGILRKYNADGTVDNKDVGIYPRMIHFTEYDK